MDTPICDFVRAYIASEAVRLHMPGHKGASFLGCERADITEIAGADALYSASGIIRASERNASALFGTADTLYSTEGSSQCISAMLYLACLLHRSQGRSGRPAVLAGRNAHKAFLRAAALLDFDICWLWPEDETPTLCQCTVSPAQLEAAFEKQEKQVSARISNVSSPIAVYLTSPDYLGHTADLPALAEVAHRHGALLIVDNAHGAYLKFLPGGSRHPVNLGADICCDSAHKTLPVLTGGAYLHISQRAPAELMQYARRAMEMFGSTSPSYLILQSLDRANAYLADGYTVRLSKRLSQLSALRDQLTAQGWRFTQGDDVLKLTLHVRQRGYSGEEVARVLRNNGIHCEYADPDYLVMMFTPENPESQDAQIAQVLSTLPPRTSGRDLPCPPLFHQPEKVLSVREAALMPGRTVPIEQAVGKVLAALCVSCPPAVSCVVSGERIQQEDVRLLAYYGISEVSVLDIPVGELDCGP